MTTADQRALSYVADETALDDLPSQANHFGPYGRCFRDIEPATETRPYAIQCRGPAVSDLGLCGDHLAEAMTW